MQDAGLNLPTALDDRAVELESDAQTVVFVTHGNIVLGALALADDIKPEAQHTLLILKKKGIKVKKFLIAPNCPWIVRVRSMSVASFKVGVLRMLFIAPRF